MSARAGVRAGLAAIGEQIALDYDEAPAAPRPAVVDLVERRRTWPGVDEIEFAFPARAAALEQRAPFLALRVEVASTRRALAG